MQSEKPRVKRFLTAIGCATAILFALVLGLLQALCPLRTLLPAFALPAREEGELRIHFLSVGQADCTLVEFPDGDLLVIDGGDGSWNVRTKLIRYIKGLSPSSLTLLMTHAELDHYGGFKEILRTFGAETLYLPVLGSENTAYTQLLQTAEELNCPVETFSRYGVIARPSGAYVSCISPYSTGEENRNDSSAVLWLSYQGVNTLLCGDISSARERRLMTEYSFDETLFDHGEYTVRLPQTDILKVAHHGSATSSSEEWLSFLQAETAVISCGRGNAYSHPAEDTINAIARTRCELYRTDELGDILITMKDGKYSVQTEITE